MTLRRPEIIALARFAALLAVLAFISNLCGGLLK